ncbi:hypothetical protein M8C21_019700 [Ambrosia artemisiifolia]|uniref:PDZ domain-containing protein n=1 Tax=Ambrosia artemisiifolia TaxID=4212 RepID=A0AAD5BN21_AMBAR|nr:hypothetical protein M8C21_019700 [Ambrosia artemisiifolia]
MCGDHQAEVAEQLLKDNDPDIVLSGLVEFLDVKRKENEEAKAKSQRSYSSWLQKKVKRKNKMKRRTLLYKDLRLGLKATTNNGGMLPLRTDDASYSKIRRMLCTLGDPFTRILSPTESQCFRIGSDGNVHRVGLFVNTEPKTIHLACVVLSRIEDSPADRAGIYVGDELVEIRGKKLQQVDLTLILDLTSLALKSNERDERRKEFLKKLEEKSIARRSEVSLKSKIMFHLNNPFDLGTGSKRRRNEKGEAESKRNAERAGVDAFELLCFVVSIDVKKLPYH